MKNYSSGLTFFDCLLLIFIVLKLLHVINWPWIWVLSPLWISLLLIVVITIVVVLYDKLLW